MSKQLFSILDALEKPLKFASRKGYSNLDKITALDKLVGDLTLKALSLPLGSEESDKLETIKELFTPYDSLDSGEKKEIIESSLQIIDGLRKSNISLAKSKEDESTKLEESLDPDDISLSGEIAKGSEHVDDLSEISVQFVKGVGPRIASVLKKKGIESVEDALNYFPRAYEDRRTVKSISKLTPGQRETVMGKIMLAGKIRTKTRSLYQIVLSDGTGTVTLVWFQFNEKYLRAAYKKGASVILTSEVHSSKT